MNAREKIAAREPHHPSGGEGEVAGAQVTYFDPEGHVEEEIRELHRCGLGGCFSPEWLQVLASKKAFMVVFSFLAVIQGMTWAYFTATITTLEKRFKITSQTMGASSIPLNNVSPPTNLSFLPQEL